MKKLRRLLMTTVVCGVLSLVAFIFGRLAMTDIYHGEPDLTLEWNIVSISFLPVLIFHLLAIVVTWYALRLVQGGPRHSVDDGRQDERKIP